MLLFFKSIWEERAHKVRHRGRVLHCVSAGREADCLRFRSEQRDLTIVDHQWWVIMRVKKNCY